MKTLFFLLSFFCFTSVCMAQRQLISYEDLKYLVENNLGKADTFLVAKGYAMPVIDKKHNTHTFTAALQGGAKSEVQLRADGKRIYIEIATDEVAQYNIIRNSIAQFLEQDTSMGDVQTYNVKHLGTIYITVNDKVPYSPIRKDYDIHLVAKPGIVALN